MRARVLRSSAVDGAVGATWAVIIAVLWGESAAWLLGPMHVTVWPSQGRDRGRCGRAASQHHRFLIVQQRVCWRIEIRVLEVLREAWVSDLAATAAKAR